MMKPGLRNFVVIIATIAVCIVVQQVFVPMAQSLPPLMVRFVLGWGLALSVGVVAALALYGSKVERLLLMLCVPAGWFLWYLLVVGIEASARGTLMLYIVYSTGFMVVGFILGEWYRHMRSLSQSARSEALKSKR